MVTQSTHDLAVLIYIQANLGFGNIIKQGDNTHRFVVQEKTGLMLLAHIFNGNMVFPTRVIVFQTFLEGVNKLITKGKMTFPSSNS